MKYDEAKLYLEHTSYDDFKLEDWQIENRLKAIKVILKENKKLKKQLEEANKMCELFGKSIYNAELYELKNQRKDFVKYLEQYIENEKYCFMGERQEDRIRQDILIEILAKYKEIVGGENE